MPEEIASFHSLNILTEEEDARQCASLMSSMDPWITFGRDYNKCLHIFLDYTNNETRLIKHADRIIGFIVITKTGVFRPYILSLAIRPEYQDKGIGGRVLKEVCALYSNRSQHIFISASSFNEGARQLYLRCGFEIFGELHGFMAEGHSEILMRKKLSSIPPPVQDPETPYITTDFSTMDFEVIYEALSATYWGKGISRENLITRMKNSLCFGLHIDGKQIGFARVITDYISFAYLADVFTIEAHRNRGMASLLLQYIFNHPPLQKVKWLLATRDAQNLYKKFDFSFPVEAERIMLRGWKPFSSM